MSLHKFQHIVKETDKAWLVAMNDVQHWIPKSACHINRDKNEILIQDWFVKKMDDAGALFSDDRKRRLVLWRQWNKVGRTALCIGLNPSNAKEMKNDPTIRHLIDALVSQGYSGFYMVNLFTIVSSSPSILLTPEAKAHEQEDLGIIFAYSINVTDVIFCWGTFDEAKERAKKVTDWFTNGLCFGINKDGSPWHPMGLHYAGLTGKSSTKARLFSYREHDYSRNIYDRKIKDKSRKNKKYEFNAKQYNLLPEPDNQGTPDHGADNAALPPF